MKELEEKIKEYGTVLPGNVAYRSRICQTFR